MSALSRTVALSAAALIALALAVSAPSFVIFWKVYQVPLRWAPGTAQLRIMLGDSQVLSDGTTYNTSAQAAAQAWSSKLSLVAFATTFAPPGATGERNGMSEVFFASTAFGREFPNAVAITASLSSSNPNKESDIIFNSKFRFDSYRGPIRSADGEWIYDLHRIMLHELGHSLGLDHPDAAGQSVDSVLNSHAGNNHPSLSEDDIAGGQALYGAPGATPPNDDFASATVLIVPASNALSVTAHNFNGTKESGEPAHAQNPGGRSVWFKWSAPIDGGVTLDTLGSYCDTTLAVYTGSTYPTLRTTASSDDIERWANHLSKVSFYARKDTTYHFAVDGHDGDSATIKLNMLIDPNAPSPPTISSHPTSLSLTTGGRGSLSVTASGSGTLTYQWFVNGATIPGATTSSYEIANAGQSDVGSYTVTVSNSNGSVTSDAATVSVAAPIQSAPSSGGGGGGGGGGAPSVWFAVALALLAALRRLGLNAPA